MKNTRWVLGIFFLVFGLVTVGLGWDGHQKWIWRGVGLYLLPLLFQLSRSDTVRIYALWFGVFLVLQTLVSPLVLNKTFVTLPPYYNTTLDIEGDGIPGIQGRQHITTDEKGFRVVPAVNYTAKPDGTHRIFVIGGSTTEELYTDDMKTWTHLLQEKLNQKLQPSKIEVINTGVSGLRAKHHLATLEKIIPYHPDMAIFLLGINDWNHYVLESHDPYGLRVAALRNAFRFDYSLLAYAMTAMKKKNKESLEPKVKAENGDYYTRQIDSLSRTTRYNFKPGQVGRDYIRYLERIARTCKRNSITCVFITQPTAYANGADEKIKKRLWMTPPNQSYTLDFESLVHLASLYNEHLKTFARENGLLVIDAVDAISPSLMYFFDDCHFNLAGSEKMAGFLLPKILDALKNLKPKN